MLKKTRFTADEAKFFIKHGNRLEKSQQLERDPVILLIGFVVVR